MVQFPDTLIEIKSLWKAFAKKHALKEISLEIRKGEFVGIIGPNGAGKTTLLHCLLGLITPDRGEIRLFGLPINSKRSEILKRVNFASSYVSLPYSLTVKENLLIYAHLYGVEYPAQSCENVMKMFDIHTLKNQPARRLSSGQMMRLNLAKAMINNPEILLLDEPTVGLDPEIALKTRNLLLKLNRERGMTILYTSHNIKEVETLCSRVVIINRGEILADGSVEELLERYASEELEALYFSLVK